MRPTIQYVTADLPAAADAGAPLFRHWREQVRPDDLVHVILSAGAEWVVPLLDALPGRKRLVAGAVALDGGYLLSPLPLHPSQLAPGEINLHGRPLRPLRDEPTHLCVGFEPSGLRPLPLAETRAIARWRLGLGPRAIAEPYAGHLWHDPPADAEAAE